MISPEQLATFLAASAARCRHDMVEATRRHMEEVAKDARALVGQERGEWDALAPFTVQQKRRLGFYGQVSDTDPLLRKGDLRDSIKGEAQETATGAEGVVGSESKIAAYQEAGTSRIPPRPFTSIAMRGAELKAAKHFGMLGIRLTDPFAARYLPK